MRKTMMGFLLLSATPAMAAAQSRLDLGGPWQRFIGDHLYDSVTVPSSYAPMGSATLRREFELARLKARQRAMLRFEGVAYEGRVRINGKRAGTAGWGRSEFDITDLVAGGSNQVEVDISDWQVPLGPNAAWEGYGGIIRETYIEVRPDPYIENARLTYAIDLEKRAADCVLDAFVRGTVEARGTLSAELLRNSVVVASARERITAAAGESVRTLRWRLDRVDLWSPEAPNLYELRVRLASDAGEHVFSTETGFRDLRVEGDRFVLNGRRLVLKGIDRHDMWKGQGFTLSAAQIEQDFRMIKAMGANTVRLCCYPTDPRNLEWANRLGLFVTEEPGLCWIRFQDAPRETVEAGLRNLEALIRRDWNSPGFFAVLFANESYPSAENLRQARNTAKKLLPRLLVSVTHLSFPLEEAKRISDEGGLDFYGHHVYDYEGRGFGAAARVFTGKPLVFTEWGGRGIGQSPIVMREATAKIARLVEQGRVAGHWFWSWQDLPEFTRQDAEMMDGILLSGVVSEERRVREDVWGALSELYSHDPRKPSEPSRAPELTPLAGSRWTSGGSEFTTISLQRVLDSPEQAAAWRELEASIAEYWRTNHFSSSHWEETGQRFWTWNAPRLHIGVVPFVTPQMESQTRPLVIRERVTIAADLEADRLHFLGNVTVPDGYPTTGELGGRVGAYTIAYADGERQEVALRWGYEVARSNMIAVASRLNPATATAARVLTYTKDIRREVHQTLLLTVPVKRKRIAEIAAALEKPAAARPPISSRPNETGSGYQAGDGVLLLYAVTGERLAR